MRSRTEQRNAPEAATTKDAVAHVAPARGTTVNPGAVRTVGANGE